MWLNMLLYLACKISHRSGRIIKQAYFNLGADAAVNCIFDMKREPAPELLATLNTKILTSKDP